MSEYKRFPSAFRGYDKKEVERYVSERENLYHKSKAEKMEELERLTARREELTARIEELEELLDSQDLDPEYIQMTGEALESRMELLSEAARRDKAAIEESFIAAAGEIQRLQADIDEQIQVCRRKFKFLLGNIRRMSKEAEAGKGRRRPELKVLQNKHYREPSPDQDLPLTEEELAEAIAKPVAVGMGNIEIKEPEKPVKPRMEEEEKRAAGQAEGAEAEADGIESAEDAAAAEPAEEPGDDAAEADGTVWNPEDTKVGAEEREEAQAEELSQTDASYPEEEEAPAAGSEAAVEAGGAAVEIADQTLCPASDEAPEAAAFAPVPPEPESTSPWALRYRFLWGKKAGANLFDQGGVPIIAKGETITSQTVDKAVAAGALDRLVRDMME